MIQYREAVRGSRVFVIPEDSLQENPPPVQPEPVSRDVRLMWLNDCPLGPRQACVNVDRQNITSFCRYMDAYPGKTNGTPVLDWAHCRYPEVNKPLKVLFLTSFTDCFKAGVCISPGGKCIELRDVFPPVGSGLSRPHFSVVCNGP
jgi:hypothetical protein